MTAKNFTLVFATLLLLASCNMKKKGEDFDVSKSLGYAELMTDSTTLANMPVYSTTDAGVSTNIERAFENAPPMIPHKINMFIPITTTSNLCFSCHKPENAKNIGATPMPNTHFTNYRPEMIEEEGIYINTVEANEVVQKEMGEELNLARYNCTQCHAPQADVTIDIENYFTPEFRKASGKDKSNLDANMTEGVK